MLKLTIFISKIFTVAFALLAKEDHICFILDVLAMLAEFKTSSSSFLGYHSVTSGRKKCDYLVIYKWVSLYIYIYILTQPSISKEFIFLVSILSRYRLFSQP